MKELRYTKAQIENIRKRVAMGLSFNAVARSLDISPRTFAKHRARAKNLLANELEGEPLTADNESASKRTRTELLALARALNASETEYIASSHDKILESKDWRASMSLLKARYPDEYASERHVLGNQVNVTHNTLQIEGVDKPLNELSSKEILALLGREREKLEELPVGLLPSRIPIDVDFETLPKEPEEPKEDATAKEQEFEVNLRSFCEGLEED